MAIGWELAEWGRDSACPVAIANRGDVLNRVLWLVLCAFTGAGVAAYCGHYGRNRAVAWRTDGFTRGRSLTWR